MTMPFLVYNLGVEMVYILCSRLKAQSIPDDKADKGLFLSSHFDGS